MGEARRKKLAGYIPKTDNQAKRQMVIGNGRRNMSLAMAALLAYPSLPDWTKGNGTTE